MRHTLVKSLVVGFGMALCANSASAMPWGELDGTKADNIVLDYGYEWSAQDYWSLADFTSGFDGESTVIIKMEQAAYESDFGFFTVDAAGEVDKKFVVMTASQEVSEDSSVVFQKNGGVWQIKLDAADSSFMDFSTTFGFFYDVDDDPIADDGFEYSWYTDKKLNQYYQGGSLDPTIEHAIVAYNPYNDQSPGDGGKIKVYLDDQKGGGDRDFTDMTVLVTDVAPVPEPSTMLLFGTGLIGLAGVARRRKGKK